MQLAELADLHDLYIISDEVYRDFIYDKEDFYSVGHFPAFRKRIVYIFSFSKTYAMTGWRVAFLAADSEITGKILGVHDAMVTCAPVVSQWAAIAALELAAEEVEHFREEFEKRRQLMCQHLERMSAWLSYHKPNSAYFAFPRMKPALLKKLANIQHTHSCSYEIRHYQQGSNSWRLALELLYHAKVAVVPGVAFGPQGEDHFRLCFGRDAADITEAMQRIEKYLKDL